jgi:hypothetical protein
VSTLERRNHRLCRATHHRQAPGAPNDARSSPLALFLQDLVKVAILSTPAKRLHPVLEAAGARRRSAFR